MSAGYPKLARMRLKDLRPFATDTRTRSREAQFIVSAQVRAFQLLKPPTFNVRTRRLLDLSEVVAALQAAGEEEVDVWCVDVPEELEVAAMFALNNRAGEWVWRPVSEHVKRFKEAGVDLKLTGFPEHDTSPLLGADWSAERLADRSEEGRLL